MMNSEAVDGLQDKAYNILFRLHSRRPTDATKPIRESVTRARCGMYNSLIWHDMNNAHYDTDSRRFYLQALLVFTLELL